MKIIIEIVLYNKKINDSTTFISLDNHKTIITQLFSQIELLIYDNSSTPQTFDIVNSVTYRSCTILVITICLRIAHILFLLKR